MILDGLKNEDISQQAQVGETRSHFRKREYVQGLSVWLRVPVSANDPRLAKQYYDKSNQIDPTYFSFSTKPNETEAMLQVGRMLEVLNRLEEALRLFSRGTSVIEGQRQTLLDRDIRFSDFGYSSTGRLFRAAARVCLKLHKTGFQRKPREFDCELPLAADSWDQQALIQGWKRAEGAEFHVFLLAYRG